MQWSAAAAGVALSGYQSELRNISSAEATQISNKEGKWITAACWHNCGGRCLNKAYVVDGIVLRQKTDDTHPDSPDFPQQRACARGRAQREQVFGKDRLRYPMKRKNWAPAGGKKELRGRDEWVRISWDEALDIVAGEIKSIKEKYGNTSILNFGGSRMMNAYGGAMSSWGTVSWGAWPATSAFMQTGSIWNLAITSDRSEIKKSKLIVLWGSNPAWSSAGNPTYNYLQAKKAGAKFIFVDSFYNPSAMALADDWIPVRPGTDTALLLGMAYYMIKNDLYDQDFLDKYTVGFDADNMPEGADSKDNFKDYVLGTYDGEPKTPEWASEICGTDPRIIRYFAQEIATTKPMSFISAFAPSRTYRGEQFCQAFVTVGWMTGNVGIPGGAVGVSAHNRASNEGPGLVTPGGAGVPAISNPIFPAHYGFPGPDPFKDDWQGPVWDETWDAVLTGEYTAGIRGRQKCNIKMISHMGMGAALNQLPSFNKGVEAHRTVDFVVSADHFLTTNAKYADVVLPATTPWERFGGLLTGNREMLIFYSQITEPLYEAKDDIWMEKEVGKRLGIDPDLIDPIPLKQQVFNQLAGATVIKEDGSGYEPLVTITSQDIQEWEVQGEPQKGRIGLSEFKEQGIYQIPRREGDKFTHRALKSFREDPEANPVDTESGKLEIYCRKLSEYINAFNWTKVDPIAKYVPAVEGYEDTKDGKYPLQLITIHYNRRAHSCLDNNLWLREGFEQEFAMNPDDAAKYGVKNGDIVKIASQHGIVIRPVYLTERLMPGVTTLGQGAWAEKDEETGIDKAGCTNTLNGNKPTGQGVQPWNTCIVKVEKYEGALLPDYKWAQRLVF